MKRRTLLGIAGSATATTLAGCAGLFENASSKYVNGTQIACGGDAYPDRIEFDCRRFDGEAGRIFPIAAGKTVSLTTSTDLDAGSVRFLVQDPDDNVLWEHSHEGSGHHETTDEFETGDQGRYHMRAEATDLEGHFQFEWEVPD